MIKRIIFIMLILCVGVYCDVTVDELDKDIETLFTLVSDKQELYVNGEIISIDLKKLLHITLMIESNYSRDKYSGRIAKTPMQIEKSTGEHYIKIVPELRNYIEESVGRKLNPTRSKDCVYIAYLIYMSKIQHHKHWLDKYIKYYNGDTEWFVYKIFWNSTAGQSTYDKWVDRTVQFITERGSEYTYYIF